VRFKSRLVMGLMILLVAFFSAGNCLANEESTTEASFLGSLLNLLILIVLIGGIILALKIHSVLKGGELSSAWFLSSLALSILFVSISMEFLSNLGIINSLPTLVFLFQLLGFFILVFGLALLKKKLS